MLSTALAALLEDEFGDAAEIAAIGGWAGACGKTTRLGVLVTYTMWRDVAVMSLEYGADCGYVASTALEQRLVASAGESADAGVAG